jgi:hypothetical protein
MCEIVRLAARVVIHEIGSDCPIGKREGLSRLLDRKAVEC